MDDTLPSAEAERPWTEETLARALHSAYNEGFAEEWEDLNGTANQGDWLRAARVALSRPLPTAPSEPTEAMVEAGAEAHAIHEQQTKIGDAFVVTSNNRRAVRAIWAAMESKR